MTPADLHAEACRCLGDIYEDYIAITPHDAMALFSASLAPMLGLPATHRARIAQRFTARQLRSILWPILDDRLEGTTALELMNEIDRALAMSPAHA